MPTPAKDCTICTQAANDESNPARGSVSVQEATGEVLGTPELVCSYHTLAALMSGYGVRKFGDAEGIRIAGTRESEQ